MKLWAISDLHVGYEENRRAVDALPALQDDWLILAGDTGETPAHLDFVLKTWRSRFAQIIWTVGNHDLWTPASLPRERRGVAHYERLVRLCRSYGVLTPEDAYAVWPGDGPRTAIVPTFTLYDYTFRPATVAADRAVAWAAESGVRCADEDLLDPSPFATRQAWCHARIRDTEARLAAIAPDTRLIVVNHWPLCGTHAVPPRVPRFSIWCGTTATDTWPIRYPIDTVVYGHLHLRRSAVENHVRFEEVSLGYPKQWNQRRPIADYLRRIR